MSMVQPVSADFHQMAENGDQAFSYRPIPILIPISIGFVLLSVSAAAMAELLVIPLIGSLLALIALRQIRLSHGGLSGAKLGTTSLFLQVAMLIGFAGMHGFMYATEVPEGFERINFTSDISKKGFVVIDGMPSVHPDVLKLANRKVMVKGYMYPTKQTEGIQNFVLCRDAGACCFGGQPKTTDMILVHLDPDHPVSLKKSLVTVAGEFIIQQTVDETGLEPVYQLKCDYFSLAKTVY